MNEELNLNDLEQASGGNDGMEYGHSEGIAASYTIQAGDTLYSIARKYNTTAKKIFDTNIRVIIAEANKHGVTCSNVNDYQNHIYPGTILVIPKN